MSNPTTDYVLQKIRKEISIIDYLSSKGISPVKTLSNGCELYLCPIHGDTDPSFRVWPSGIGKYSYENYKCFGCKSGHDIVRLYADLEYKGDWKLAIQNLVKRVDCTFEGSIDYLVEEIKKENEQESASYYEDSLECYYLKISDLVKNYVKNVKYDPEEMNFTENLFKIIDSYLWSYDLSKLKKSYKFLSENSNNKNFIGQSALKIRYYNWIKKQEQIQRGKYNK